MKTMKKIAAIMLSVMMVLGMCSVVGAEGATSGTSASNQGKITINNAKKGQTYTIYRILELESFSEKTETPGTGNYAYKVATGWENFLTDTNYEGVNYLQKGTDGYVTIKTSASTDFSALAKSALQYVKDNSTTTFETKTVPATATGTVEFKDLKLGYYLVDSSTGALCSLNTTATDVTIQEKNGVPSVEKKIVENTTTKGSNTASIGDTIKFQTTITAQPGAQNYVLHDKMSKGLTFESISKVQLKKAGATATSDLSNSDYDVKTGNLETPESCTFHVEFKQSFCDTLGENDQIIVTYSATLNEKAVIAGEGNKNETWLKYGDASETTHDTTTTKTYAIPVFKYTNKNGTDKGLPGAIFTLSKSENGENPIKLVATETANTYRVAKEIEKTGITKITEVTTPDDGKFTIQGLDAGRYYLTETQQPAGYNKLKAPLVIVIDDESGAIKVDSESTAVTEVKVLNKTGSLLPSTGGMGTTLFYIFGAILVIGSGVVLITKKRMK